MRFQVPQFVGVEDKIFGPFTFKQFIFIAGGGGISFILWNFLGWWSIPFIVPVLSLTAALAFYKLHGKPFIQVMESAFKYYSGSRLYTWKKLPSKKIIEQAAVNAQKPQSQVYVPKLSTSKLKDLTWSLDIKENLNPLTRDDELRHGHMRDERLS